MGTGEESGFGVTAAYNGHVRGVWGPHVGGYIVEVVSWGGYFVDHSLLLLDPTQSNGAKTFFFFSTTAYVCVTRGASHTCRAHVFG